MASDWCKLILVCVHVHTALLYGCSCVMFVYAVSQTWFVKHVFVKSIESIDKWRFNNSWTYHSFVVYSYRLHMKLTWKFSHDFIFTYLMLYMSSTLAVTVVTALCYSTACVDQVSVYRCLYLLDYFCQSVQYCIYIKEFWVQ